MQNSLTSTLLKTTAVLFGCGFLGLTLHPSLAYIYVPPSTKDTVQRKGSDQGITRTSLSKTGLHNLMAFLPTADGLKAAIGDEKSAKMDANLIQTTHTQPSFAFFIPTSCPDPQGCSLSFELLTVEGQNAPLWTQSMAWPSERSLVQFSMENAPVQLEVGGEYRWWLFVRNSQGMRMFQHSLKGVFTVREPSMELETALTRAQSERERYLAYGTNGDWLAMMAALLESYSSNPNDEQVQDDWESTLPLMQMKCEPLTVAAESKTTHLPIQCFDLAIP